MIGSYGLAILDFPDQPPRGRLLMLGLWLNADRQETRRSWILLRAIQDAFNGHTPEAYFHATCEDALEAQCKYRLHVSRANSISTRPPDNAEGD